MTEGSSVRRVGVLGDGEVARRARAVLERRDGVVAVRLPDLGPAAGGEVDAVAVAVPWGAVADDLDHVGVPVVGVEPTPVVPAPGRLPSAGWLGGVTQLVAAVGLVGAAEPDAVHVASALPDPRRARASASRARRRTAVDLLHATGEALVDGERVTEAAGLGRRLAWFPRPVGPCHAVSVPLAGTTALVADHPTLRTARGWTAARSLVAEAVQAAASRPRDGALGRALDGWAGRGPDRADGGGVRWAVVAEVREGTGGVVRAWANGTGPGTATGTLLALAAERVVDRPDATDVRDLGGPGELLDVMADLGVLRWSVARPTPSQR